MPALKTLSPRVGTLSLTRLTEAAKPGVEQRIRGRAGMRLRQSIHEQHRYLCAECERQGRYRHARIIDHIIPLEDGGSNDTANQEPLCIDCHDTKTAREAVARAKDRGGVV